MSTPRAYLNLLALSSRNLWRNTARTAITLGAIVLGCFGSITLASFGNGLGIMLTKDTIESKVGALQIHRAGYAKERENQPLNITLPATGTLYELIAATPGVRAAAPRLVFAGMINNGRESTMVFARAVDPSREYLALASARGDVLGTPIDDAHPDTGVLGQDLATALGAQAGGLVTLQAATQAGRQNALDLTVGGLLDNANVFESKRLVHVPLDFAQRLLGMPEEVTEIVVGVHDVERVEAVAASLRERLGAGYEVETWGDLQPNVRDMVQYQAVVIGIVSMVFLVIVIFGVMNTMFMSVMERTREIGTIMALGMRRARITGMFLTEAAMLAVLGASGGIALALACVGLIGARGGVSFAAPGSTVERMNLVPTPPDGWLLAAFCAAVLGAMLAAAYPAYRAARLRPVEALRVI